MNFNEFCHELSNATATGNYTWLLTDATSQLRATHPGLHICCPVTTVYHYRTGKFAGISQAVPTAESKLGLHHDLARQIVLAADGYYHTSEACKIRPHLLKATRLGDSQ